MTYTYTGPGHIFYQYGETYTLHIKRYPIFSRVYIEVWRGKDSVINDSLVRYKNWEAFQRDWREAKV